MDPLEKFVSDWFSDVKSIEDLTFGQFVFAFTSFLWLPFYRLFRLFLKKRWLK